MHLWLLLLQGDNHERVLIEVCFFKVLRMFTSLIDVIIIILFP
jgi:hypothetical protein